MISMPTRFIATPLEVSQRQVLEEVGRRFGAEFQVLDADFRPIFWHSPCGACTATTSDNEVCLLRRNPPLSEEPYSFSCPLGVGKLAAAVSFRGHPIAYLVVTEPADNPLGVERMKARLSTSALAFGALYDSRWLIEVQQDARAAILAAPTQADVFAAAHSALRQLLGEMDAVLYVREASGGFAVDRSISGIDCPERVSLQDENVVAWVARNATTSYCPDLSESPPFRHGFVQSEPQRPYRSIVTLSVPITGAAPGAVIQCASLSSQAFSGIAIQSAEIVLALAGMRVHQIRTMHEQRLFALREFSSKTWQETVWEILAATQDKPERALDQKRILYRAFADEARRLAGAFVASVRLLNSQQQLRFVACSGDNWTEYLKRLVYTREEPSAGMSAVISDAPVYIDNAPAQENLHRRIFPSVKSVYALPFHEFGKPAGALSVDREVEHGFNQDLREQLLRLRNQFEIVLQFLAGIEQSLFQSLEMRLLESFDVAAFCRDAKRIVRQLLDTGDCEILLSTNGPSSLSPVTDSAEELENPAVWSQIRFLSEQALAENAPQSRTTTVPVGTHPRRSSLCLAQISDSQVSITCAPFRRPGCSGVVTVWTETGSSGFGAEEETTLDQIASWIGGALAPIVRVQYEEKMRDDAEEQAAVAEKLLQSESVQSVATVLAEKILRDESAGSVHIRVPGEDPGELDLAGAAGLYSKSLPPKRRAQDGISGLILNSGAPYWAEEVQADPLWGNALAWLRGNFGAEAAEWIKSACGLPLAQDGRFLGTLLIDWRDKRSFPEKERVRLEAVGTEVAARIDAVQRLENRLRDLRKVRHHALRFLSAQDTDAVLDLVLDAALELCQQQYGTIRTYRPDTDVWVLHRRPTTNPLHPDEVSNTPVFRRIIESLRPCASPDLSQDSVWQEEVGKISAEQDEYRRFLLSQGSLIQVPVLQDDGVVHALTLYSTTPRAITNDALDLLHILAAFAAIAIRNAELLRLNQPFALMGQMAGGFLHVIGNQVNDMSAVIETIADPLCAPEEISTEYATLRQCISRLRGVCRDLARASTAEPAMYESVSLNKTVEIALADFATSASASCIKVEKQLGSVNETVRGNEGQIEIAFRMVVQNALEAMGELAEGKERRLTVNSGVTDQGEAFIRFEDTGPGMDADTVARCRLPFFSTKFHRGGSGLGLAVADGIARRHGSRLDIASQVGVGSVFTFVFPKEE
jgi:signal transduction histidine kinase